MKNTLELVKHSIRVSKLAFLLARKLKLSFKMIFQITLAAALHDVGKLRLKQTILNKPGKLTEVEYSHIKNHVELGIDILRKYHVPNEICTLVMQHHESSDGTGYPYGLKGEEIYLGSRILKVADVYDALITERIYRKKYNIEKAIGIMLKDMSSYDSIVLRCLFNMVGKKELKNKGVIFNNLTDKI